MILNIQHALLIDDFSFQHHLQGYAIEQTNISISIWGFEENLGFCFCERMKLRVWCRFIPFYKPRARIQRSFSFTMLLN